MPALWLIGLFTFCFGSVIASDTKNDVYDKTGFRVYWNVPTFMCRQYGMYFEDVVGRFNIIQNEKDQFRGDQIAILYDPGAFPALLKQSDGHLMIRNGGVPQEGNLTFHLELFSKHLNEQIKDRAFNGLGVIDFESWRPIFRQNWASLAPYRDYSLTIERQKHPWWNKGAIQRTAVENFEKYGRLFMEETLKLAKYLRPLATWGYYAFPYCFNVTPNQPGYNCDPRALEENNRLKWLFENEDTLLPSVYLRYELSPKNRMGLIRGRVEEARRIVSKIYSRPSVIAYFWYKYQDRRDIFLSKNDVRDGLQEVYDNGGDGVVIWGSSMDLQSKSKCQKLMNYVNDILGPEVLRVTQQYSARSRYEVNDSIFDLFSFDFGR